MVSWSTIQTLVLLFGPIVLPRALSVYRSLRHGNQPTRPLKRNVRVCLNVLFVAIVLALASSLSYLHDENIITALGSRLMLTPSDILSRRLESLRQQQGLPSVSSNDEKLLGILKTREGRLLYAAYGPDPLLGCSWCSISDPNTYLYYAIPTMAIPHGLNIAVLGFVTSSTFSNEGRNLRIYATISGLGIALAELTMLYNFDITQNTRAASPGDVNWYHWKLLTYRGLTIAIVDFVFGAMIYVRATGRYGFGVVSDSEKIEAITKSVDVALGHVRTGLFVKSTAIRNDQSLTRFLDFWNNEASNRRGIADQLTETRNKVLERVDIDSINEEAFRFTSSLMDAVVIPRTSSNGSVPNPE